MTVTLRYTRSGTIQTRVFPVLAVKGSDTPDAMLIHGVQHRYLNGSTEEQILGLNKRISIDFGVVEEREARAFLADFIKAEQRSYEYSTQNEGVVLEKFEDYANEWLEDIELGRRFILPFISEALYKQFPVAAEVVELMYLKKKVKIEGTQASPESFTTNVGKLATMETGAAYPVFNAATHVFTVDVNGSPYQEAKVNIVGMPSISGGNITFQAAVSDFGNASGDGFYYADVKIQLQAI